MFPFLSYSSLSCVTSLVGSSFQTIYLFETKVSRQYYALSSLAFPFALSFMHVVVPCIHQVLGEDPVTFPNFRNLRTLFLGYCDLSE
jgi:hypothetical protein